MAPRATTQTMTATKNPSVNAPTPTNGRRRPTTNGNRAQTPRAKPAPVQTTVEDRIEAQDAADETAEPEIDAAAETTAPEPDADDAIVEAYRSGQAAAVPSQPVLAQPLETTPPARTRRPRSTPVEPPAPAASTQPTEDDLKQLGAFAFMAIQQDKPMSALADELEILLNTYRKFGVPF
jgi:hypothetical protein